MEGEEIGCGILNRSGRWKLPKEVEEIGCGVLKRI
jgi:hypothetical protein